MVASSVSTYLDVAQATKHATAESPADTDLKTRGKVLAAIYAGAGSLTDLTAKTEIPANELLAALTWLSDNELVKLRRDDSGGVHAELTESARTALSG